LDPSIADGTCSPLLCRILISVDGDDNNYIYMWYQLGLFGSRVVEAVSVGSDKVANTHHEKVVEAVVGADSAEEPEEDRAYGEHEKVTVVEAAVGADSVGTHHDKVTVIKADSAEEPEEDRAYGEHEKVTDSVGTHHDKVTVVKADRMEGSDASALIAKRLGITQGEVESKLLALHQKGELDGRADRPSPSQPDAGAGNISLTSMDLEEFEKAEAEARGNRAQTGTLYKLTFKPAVLGDPLSASPLTATSAAPSPPAESAPAQLAPSSPSSPSQSAPAPSAERQEGGSDVAMVLDADTQPTPSTSSKWWDEMEAEEEVLAEEVKDETDVWPEQRRYGEAGGGREHLRRYHSN
jgi:hypothetical protein